MTISRRSPLAVVPAGLTFSALALRGVPARADDNPTRAERFIGKPDAKVTVGEYFSLTCTHCAAFAQETFPEVKQKLIDSGEVWASGLFSSKCWIPISGRSTRLRAS